MKKILKIIAGIVLLLISAAAVLIFQPPTPLPGPVGTLTYKSYDEAIAAVADFDEPEAAQLRPDCTSLVYHSGKKEARSIILFHGYTNCPLQFAELGQRLQAKGYNVLIPRTPGHGYQDRLTEALADVSAVQFTDYIQQSVAIAAALGDDVTVVGLSGGGTFTLWADLFEPEADRFIAIAPVAYPRGFDPILRNAVVKYAAVRPNEFKWWNDQQKNELPGPPHAYRRYSTRSMGVIMNMASTVESAMAAGKKLPKPITFVINEADKALYSDKLIDLSNAFEAAGAKVTRHIFKASEELPHDLIDAYNIKEHKEYVYQTLLDLIN